MREDVRRIGANPSSHEACQLGWNDAKRLSRLLLGSLRMETKRVQIGPKCNVPKTKNV